MGRESETDLETEIQRFGKKELGETRLGVVAHTCNPSNLWEAEEGGSLQPRSLRLQ